MSYKKVTIVPNVVHSDRLTRRRNYLRGHFSHEFGFGDQRQLAIRLLRRVISVLDELLVENFLISGTLLGFVRHNDFIPWDDDIDLLVERHLFEKINMLVEKSVDLSVMSKKDHDCIKVCFKTEGVEIPDNEFGWKQHLVSLGGRYNFPFIDLFPYDIVGNEVRFFQKTWDYKEFFPLKAVSFLGVSTKIPCNPDYFLRRNYEPDYMTVIRSSSHSHKLDRRIPGCVYGDIKELQGLL